MEHPKYQVYPPRLSEVQESKEHRVNEMKKLILIIDRLEAQSNKVQRELEDLQHIRRLLED